MLISSNTTIINEYFKVSFVKLKKKKKKKRKLSFTKFNLVWYQAKSIGHLVGIKLTHNGLFNNLAVILHGVLSSIDKVIFKIYLGKEIS